MAGNAANAEQIEVRQTKAWELRVRGRSYRDIGASLGISTGQAFKDVKVAQEREREEANDTVDHHRSLQLARIDTAVDKLWPAIERGETEAMRVLVRLEKRRAELLGLDAPAKHSLDLNAIVAASPAAAARLVREQFGGAGGKEAPPDPEPGAAEA